MVHNSIYWVAVATFLLGLVGLMWRRESAFDFVLRYTLIVTAVAGVFLLFRLQGYVIKVPNGVNAERVAIRG